METDEQQKIETAERIISREQFVRDKVVELFRAMNVNQTTPEYLANYTYDVIAELKPRRTAYRALVEHLFPESS